MEERIIDDELKRGVRLRKTKDGYVDVTDELLDEETDEAMDGATDEGYEDGEGTEILFEFPDLEEDDEELAGLTAEEAAQIRKRREEDAAARKAEYERAVGEGKRLLATGSFKAAELKFEKALKLDDEAQEASVGYWRAKTSDFAEPDELVEAYVGSGYETLEYELGFRAVDEIKQKYRDVFERRRAELAEEEAPLEKIVQEKRENRREILKGRLKKSALWFAVSILPALAALILTIVFGMKILSTPDGRYIAPTVAFAVVFVVCFIVFGVMTNKLINTVRIYRANEKLSSTEEGKKLIKVREYKELYERLLD